MNTRRVAAGNGAVTVREWGAANGQPLVFWHGLNPFGALALNEAGPAWAADGFRVVAVAAPGIADDGTLPDPAAYRPTRLADLVVSVADELGLGRFVFVGWSWGASIGVHLGVRHTSRLNALVLLDAGHTDIPEDHGETLDETLVAFSEQQQRYHFPDWDAFVSAVRERHPDWRGALEERFRAGMREEGAEIVARSDPRAAAAAWHFLVQEQPSATHGQLGRTTLPVLLVLARRNDTTVEAERFRALVPQLEMREIDADHDLLADAPEETIRTVSDWLRSAVSSAH